MKKIIMFTLIVCMQILSTEKTLIDLQNKVVLNVYLNICGQATVLIKESSGDADRDQAAIELIKDVPFPENMWNQQHIMEVEEE